jgi:hypothetical protein
LGKSWIGFSEEEDENTEFKKNCNSRKKSRKFFLNSQTNFPENSLNNTIGTSKHNQISSNNNEKRKKEIIFERPSNYSKKENEKESFSRKDSQNSTRISQDPEHAKILRSFTNTNLIQNISNSNLNHSDIASITNVF